MKFLLLTSLLVLGLSAGDHKEGEGCINDDQCEPGLKCKWDRNLQLDMCKKDTSSTQTPAPAPEEPAKDETPPADETSTEANDPRENDFFKAFQDAVEHLINTILPKN